MNAPMINPMPQSLYDQMRGDDAPECGCGVLVAQTPDLEVVLPLLGTTVDARLVGPASQVTVEQRFRNDRSTPLECVYIFPLPERAAVSELRFTIGDRTLVAELTERQQAQQRYDAARDAGQRAALLTQERADVFTVRVASIQPGEEVVVHLVTSQLLPFDDGGFVFRFPLVLAPRYTPEGVTLDQPPRLLPEVRPTQDLSISVTIDPGGLAVTDLRSSQHATSTGMADGMVKVDLARSDELPNRDFVLRIRLAGKDISGAAWSYEDAGTRWLLALLLPPADLASAPRVPREVVLVVDTSGSMGGTKMPAAVEAARLVLRTLEPGDQLQVVEFNSRHRKLWRAAKAVDDAAIAEADRFLAGLRANGGTEILSPLKDALRKDAKLPRHLVLITDGQVGNEAEIVKYVAGLDQRLSVFTIGIDTAVHAAFLRSMARETGGLCTLMTPSDPIADRVTRFLARVGAPVATDVRIEGVTGQVWPASMPDLYLGEPVVALLSTEGTLDDARVSVQTAAGSRTLFLPTPADGGAALEALHGGAEVRVLGDRYGLHRDEHNRAALLKRSLETGVLCELTGFVVVDPTETSGVRPQTTHVPVMQPDQWAMNAAGAPPPPQMMMRGAPVPSASMPGRAGGGGARRRMAKRKAAPKGGLFSKVMDAFGGRAEGSSFDKASAPHRESAAMDFDDTMDLEESAEAPMSLSAPEPAPAPKPQTQETPSLSSLVLDQRLDGSFPARVGASAATATAEMLARMLAEGSTDATGTWRSHVAKAARWLLGQLPTLTPGTERDAVVAVLEQWASALGTEAAREKLAAAR
ncbi:MAG: VWA domain-containing protein [Deltaproteobacteria bacterium]|nr:VWA domain-containing protein [Deltaproteobacteria bacterium]